MANGRGGGGRSKRDTSRDPGGFVALPYSVLDSPRYMALSATARSLLLEVARQCKGDDNGRLLLSRAYLAGRGWKSADVIQRAKGELLAASFIFETVKGHRPNKASWYALTWRKLDKINGLDLGAEKAFEQGAYKRDAPLLDGKKLRGYAAASAVSLRTPKNAPLIPSTGTSSAGNAPLSGTVRLASVPSDGAMHHTLDPPAVPSNGHHLEVPSVVAASGRCRLPRPSACDLKVRVGESRK